MEKLITPGLIAKETGIPLYTVQYYLQSRNIVPTCRAGRLRVYGPEIIDWIRNEYKSIHGAENND